MKGAQGCNFYNYRSRYGFRYRLNNKRHGPSFDSSDKKHFIYFNEKVRKQRW